MDIAAIEEQEEELKKQKYYESLVGSSSSQLTSKIMQLSQTEELKNQLEKEFEDLVFWVTNIEKKIKQVTQRHN